MSTRRVECRHLSYGTAHCYQFVRVVIIISLEVSGGWLPECYYQMGPRLAPIRRYVRRAWFSSCSLLYSYLYSVRSTSHGHALFPAQR